MLKHFQTTAHSMASQYGGTAVCPGRNLYTDGHTDSTFMTWDMETMEPYWRTVMLPRNKSVTLTAAGQILHGDRDGGG